MAVEGSDGRHCFSLKNIKVTLKRNLLTLFVGFFNFKNKSLKSYTTSFF